MYKNILGLCLIILCLSVGLALAKGGKPVPHTINSSVVLFPVEDIIEVDEITVFSVFRSLIFWLSPGVFFVGVLLIVYGKYKSLETMLDREYGIRKKIFPKLESNNFSFHKWLLKNNILMGIICIVCSLIFFFVLK